MPEWRNLERDDVHDNNDIHGYRYRRDLLLPLGYYRRRFPRPVPGEWFESATVCDGILHTCLYLPERRKFERIDVYKNIELLCYLLFLLRLLLLYG